MGAFKDLTGQKFNRLTVLGLGKRNSNGQIQWKCKCDCGNIVFATTTYLKTGHIGLIDINKKYYDQNGIKKLAIGYRDTPFSGYVCILRPKNQNALGLNSGYNVGQTYTLTTNVKVRDGAGTNARRKKKSELTADGQKNALDQENATLKEGTEVTVQEVKNLNGDIWVRIPSGWIAGKYQGNTYLK